MILYTTPINQKKKRKGETIVVKGTLYWYG